MSTIRKSCKDCGMPVPMGLANCGHCGAQIGTLFSETAAHTAPPAKKKRRNEASEYVVQYQKIETAQDRANSAFILSLASFFPAFGLLLAPMAIALGAIATKTLRANHIEEGRGSALAGLVIGALGLVAQGGYVMYVVQLGRIPFIT
ncbi:MAG TPA: DUF4190 domain-containing protein [Blastocatellia bacterium]